MPYWLRVLVAIDQLLTALLGGYPDESLSSYAWRLERQRKPAGIFRRIIDGLFFWHDQHCYRAMLAERQRLQVPPELRA